MAADRASVQNGTVLVADHRSSSLPIAAIAFARSGGGLEADRQRAASRSSSEPAPRRAGEPPPEVDRAIQAAEARQMLEAKSYRRQRARRGAARRRGGGRAAARPRPSGARRRAIDEELRAEVRQLVIARNERRLRDGQEPLDVEAETERQLADLIGSS